LSPSISEDPIDSFSDREYLGFGEEFEVEKNLISVVDDDESIRRTTTFLIESFGFRAAAFESAEGFLKSGQLHDTSCLLVDVQMPGMNGLQLQSELAASGYGIPIIFITAHDNKDSRQQAMQAGAVAFLGKPFNDEGLLQAIRLALRAGFVAARNLIAVVDDDESVRRTTTFLIESFGFRAAAFESAQDFLSSSQLNSTSCLILDLRMPQMNGLELQSKLAAAGYAIPVIFITAYDDRDSRGRAMQAGAIAFLCKPFSGEQLLQTVRSALQHDEGSTNQTG
jgi:FixJ family two-component response regulator